MIEVRFVHITTWNKVCKKQWVQNISQKYQNIGKLFNNNLCFPKCSQIYIRHWVGVGESAEGLSGKCGGPFWRRYESSARNFAKRTFGVSFRLPDNWPQKKTRHKVVIQWHWIKRGIGEQKQNGGIFFQSEWSLGVDFRREHKKNMGKKSIVLKKLCTPCERVTNLQLWIRNIPSLLKPQPNHIHPLD